ncbi:hypothetical protein ACODT3_38575 [Streptomyces sp. 4.24]|uniref:hypothetical protein n=1 Tax=Streptomyces tritrimontium TaxID=3406573 RepID=UPI003BB52676
MIGVPGRELGAVSWKGGRMALNGWRRLVLDGLVFSAVAAAGWWTGRHGHDRTASLLWSLSVLTAVVALGRTGAKAGAAPRA